MIRALAVTVVICCVLGAVDVALAQEPTETPTPTQIQGPSPDWQIAGELDSGGLYFVERSTTWGDVAKIGMIGALCVIGFIKVALLIVERNDDGYP
jgi:hypothetical protein